MSTAFHTHIDWDIKICSYQTPLAALDWNNGSCSEPEEQNNNIYFIIFKYYNQIAKELHESRVCKKERIAVTCLNILLKRYCSYFSFSLQYLGCTRTHQGLERQAEERGSHSQTQRYCHNLDSPGEKQTVGEILENSRQKTFCFQNPSRMRSEETSYLELLAMLQCNLALCMIVNVHNINNKWR